MLDFALNKLGIAVGRVQFMHLYPLSFAEYLTASGLQPLREYLFKRDNDPVIAQQLIEHLKTYMWLGGMPAVVEAWLQNKNALMCQRIQDEIIESYQIDFHKYAKQHEIPAVTKVFEALPALLSNKFIYSHVDEYLRVDVIKNALTLLETAGIAIFCHHTSAHSLPLGAMQNDKKFKVFYFDIGIAQRLLDAHPNTPFGVKISLAPFSQHHNLMEVPLYALESWFKEEIYTAFYNHTQYNTHIIKKGLKHMTHPPYRKLYRSRKNRMIAGICGGLADHFAIDPTVFRIITALLILLGGLSFFVYLLLWVIIPLEPRRPRGRIIDLN